MKITPEDMGKVRQVFREDEWRAPLTQEERDLALAHILERIYDRGYAEGRSDEYESQQQNDL